MVANNEKTTKKLGGVTGKGFMPGVSGNPSGRPKNTLKTYIAQKLSEMSEREKEEWLKEHKIPGDLQWRMAEGNPAQDIGGDPNKPLILQVAPEVADLINELNTETKGGVAE